MVPWLLIEFIWRRKHHGDLWGGVMKTLKEVSFSRSDSNPAWLTDFSSITNNELDDISEDN